MAAPPYPWYCRPGISPVNYLWIAQRLNCATPQWDTSANNWESCMQSGPFSIIYQATHGAELLAQQPGGNLLTSFTYFCDLLSGSLRSAGLPLPGSANVSASPTGLLAANLARDPAALAQQPADRQYIRIEGSLRGESELKLDPFYVLTQPEGSADRAAPGRTASSCVPPTGGRSRRATSTQTASWPTRR